MTLAETTSIACTLSPGDVEDRLQWIAQLNRDALRRHRRRDLTLDLIYAPESVPRVREMILREQECCAFLSFELRERPDEAQLIIRAPEDAREAVDLLFEQFVENAANTGAACDCTPRSSVTSISRRGRKAAGVALVSAACAVAACSVCVLPVALPAVLLAGVGGALAWFYNAHVWMTALAVVALAVAWLWVWRQSARAEVRPATSTLTMMGLATLLVGSALFWPEIETEILRLVAG